MAPMVMDVMASMEHPIAIGTNGAIVAIVVIVAIETIVTIGIIVAIGIIV